VTDSSKNAPDSAAGQLVEIRDVRFLQDRRSDDLAEMLSNLENNKFIPLAALTSVAEILTYLYDKDSGSVPADSESVPAESRP
jgi:type III secretion system FlhB-like substrate exporter